MVNFEILATSKFDFITHICFGLNTPETKMINFMFKWLENKFQFVANSKSAKSKGGHLDHYQKEATIFSGRNFYR